MNWTPDIVMVRLIDAYIAIERLPTRDRRGGGNGWPNMLMFETSQEAYEFELTDLLQDDGRAMSSIRQTRRDDIIRAGQKAVPAETISMAMEAARWPIDLVDGNNADLKREILIAYSTCRARNRDWTKVLKARNRRVPKENIVSRLKSYRWNDQSCQRISDRLNKDNVPLRLPLDCSMIQPEAKSTRETATLASHAWMASDAKPRHLPEMLE